MLIAFFVPALPLLGSRGLNWPLLAWPQSDNLSVSHSVDMRQIVDVFQSKIEIQRLPGFQQVLRASADQAGVDRGRAPFFHDGSGSLIVRLEARVNQLARDPGATNLILFAKLTARSRADQCHVGVMIDEVLRCNRMIPETREVRKIALPRGMNQFRSRGRQQHQRALRIHAHGQFGRAVVDLEFIRKLSCNFAGQQGVVVFALHQLGGFLGGAQESSADRLPLR